MSDARSLIGSGGDAAAVPPSHLPSLRIPRLELASLVSPISLPFLLAPVSRADGGSGPLAARPGGGRSAASSSTLAPMHSTLDRHTPNVKSHRSCSCSVRPARDAVPSLSADSSPPLTAAAAGPGGVQRSQRIFVGRCFSLLVSTGAEGRTPSRSRRCQVCQVCRRPPRSLALMVRE